jgi:cyclic-di-AMP phosphodiesterase PgpH
MKNRILNAFRGLLQRLLTWVDSRQKTSSRQGSLFSKEIHVPTPIVTIGTALVLFALLVPHVGFESRRVIALAGFILLLTTFFVLYFLVDLPQFVHDDEAVFLAGLCLVLGVGLIEICNLAADKVKGIPTSFGLYAVPLGAISIVVTLLLNIRLAMLITMVLCFFCGVLNQFSFNATFVTFFSCAAGMLASRRIRTRADIVWAGVHIAWVTALCLLGLSLFHGWPAALTLKRLLWPLVNGALCTLIVLGLLPMLEVFFSKITPITLLEVGDFNRPLLRQLMLEAPGTYHHTLLVSALAEQAGEAIGANSLLCRVGMYYHDIGKLMHPEYFIENQTMRRDAKEKPEMHDKLNPSISSLVIMSHVKDGD